MLFWGRPVLFGNMLLKRKKFNRRWTDGITTKGELRRSVILVSLATMTAILKAQMDMRDPVQDPPAAAQAVLERRVFELRQRLKSAERQAASESVAHEDQAKLAETMARAARAEAREREALSLANAELAALVRSMEAELMALKAEYAAAPEPDAEGEDETPAVLSDDAEPLAPPAREDGETATRLHRTPFWMSRIAVAGLCLAAVGVGAILYPVVTGFLNGRAEMLMGRATAISGDTIRIDGKTVRLLGIDAPQAGTAASARATHYMRKLTAGQPVRCESEGRRVGADVLARCFIGTVDLGQVMLLSGNAVLRQSALRGNYRR